MIIYSQLIEDEADNSKENSRCQGFILEKNLMPVVNRFSSFQRSRLSDSNPKNPTDLKEQRNLPSSSSSQESRQGYPQRNSWRSPISFGPILPLSDKFGQYQKMSRPIWTSFSNFEQVFPILNKFEPIFDREDTPLVHSCGRLPS